MTRDRVESALRRIHTDALHNTTIDVFEPTESFEQAEGWSVTYSDTADATYDARVDSPSDEGDRDDGGTTAEIDVEIRVRDDTGQTWTAFGDETEAPVRVEDTETGVRYEIETKVDEHNGTIVLGAVEV